MTTPRKSPRIPQVWVDIPGWPGNPAGWSGNPAAEFSWQDYGICTSHESPDLWAADHRWAQQEPIRLCGRCPVREACLEYALTLPDPQIIMGGLTKTGQKRLRRDRNIARAQQGQEQQGVAA